MKRNQVTSLLSQATGPVEIPMTNDYLFRALLQKNNKVLKGFICSLLHLSPKEVLSVTILNPIELGAAIDEKNFLLDIRCLLNDNTIINLEMQVINQHNWPERSLSYLSRSFDNLNRGDEYLHVKTAIQISILDFTLFPDAPEFFATYMMSNIKNHKIYSGKFRLSVLDLTHINLATEEDKHFHIDYWASLFKAITWEEIKMLAQKDPMIEEASNTILQLTQDEQIRLQCEAREDFLYWQRVNENYTKELEEYKRQLEDHNQQLEGRNQQLEGRNQQLEGRNQQLEGRNQQLEESQRRLEEDNKNKDAAIAQLSARISELQAIINETNHIR
ncbi:MAG: Rpn family recombination-promoting nuclease/putative transposase [Lachnospiraceae bacterium]